MKLNIDGHAAFLGAVTLAAVGLGCLIAYFAVRATMCHLSNDTEAALNRAYPFDSKACEKIVSRIRVEEILRRLPLTTPRGNE